MRAYYRILQLRRTFVTRAVKFLCTSLICAASCQAAPNEHRRRIYFLEALEPTQFAAIRTIDAFKKRMTEKTGESFDIFIDYMELERFPGQAHIDSTVRYLTEKYAEAPPDILIPLGRAAIPFMVKYRDAIAPNVPIIMANMPANAVTEGKTLGNTVWVATEYNFPKTFELAQRLQPAARHVAVIGGASAYDRSLVDDIRSDLGPYLDRYEVRYLVGLTYDQMLNEISRLAQDTIILMSFVFQDGDGLPRAPPDVAAAVAKAASSPVYSPIGSFFGRGIVGGYMDSFAAHGVAAADLAFEVLSGKPIAALNRQTEPLHRYEVDSRALERWGFSNKSLLPDTVVSFGQPTLWEQHAVLLIVAAAVFALQAGLVLILLIQQRRKKQAEAEAAEQRGQVTHLMRVSALGELSGAIAHEINQPLTAILSNAQAALHLLTQESPNLPEIREAISDIVHDDNRAGDVITRLRNLLKKGERRVEQVDINKLVHSTLALLNSELIGRHVAVETDLFADLPTIRGDPVQLQQVLLNLFMNAMDAMASAPNAMRRITVRTRAEYGAVEVRIRDRGLGIGENDEAKLFQPFYTSKEHGLGLGLTVCASIAQAHGGKITVANHADRGAVAVLSLPSHELVAAAAK
jgi:signal transduction histidine kinase